MLQGFVNLLQMSEFNQPINKKIGKFLLEFKRVAKFSVVPCVLKTFINIILRLHKCIYGLIFAKLVEKKLSLRLDNSNFHCTDR